MDKISLLSLIVLIFLLTFILSICFVLRMKTRYFPLNIHESENSNNNKLDEHDYIITLEE